MLIIEQLTTETEHFKIQIHAQEETVVIFFLKIICCQIVKWDFKT